MEDVIETLLIVGGAILTWFVIRTGLAIRDIANELKSIREMLEKRKENEKKERRKTW